MVLSISNISTNTHVENLHYEWEMVICGKTFIVVFLDLRILPINKAMICGKTFTV